MFRFIEMVSIDTESEYY
jgi:predicted choloylglycine hydrolase